MFFYFKQIFQFYKYVIFVLYICLFFTIGLETTKVSDAEPANQRLYFSKNYSFYIIKISIKNTMKIIKKNVFRHTCVFINYTIWYN